MLINTTLTWHLFIKLIGCFYTWFNITYGDADGGGNYDLNTIAINFMGQEPRYYYRNITGITGIQRNYWNVYMAPKYSVNGVVLLLLRTLV